ncbi:hypothetical protein D9Q98_003284 [Chlorella vulgaris]|uniref:RRM domain-containing protein n=1 Tax=Chlorella vulgaris TaxID=3077 RepID=A0A9D4YYC3_CHLVU|nr:hypothetical protein D9Q98_003284 [Chlorella vulgaris]
MLALVAGQDEGYQAALACNGEQCDGQTLKVMKCRPSPKDRQAAQQAQQAQQQQAPAQYAPPSRYEASPAVPAAPQQQAAVQQEERPAYQQRRAEGEEGGTVAGPPKKLYAGPAPKTPGYHVAYVGNVAYEADDKALSRLFEPCGVTKVRLHTDKDTGKPKGFAHVHFQEEAGLDQAVALDGTNLLGRRIRVGYAQPKRE